MTCGSVIMMRNLRVVKARSDLPTLWVILFKRPIRKQWKSREEPQVH